MLVYIILDPKGLPLKVLTTLQGAAKYLINGRTIYGPIELIEPEKTSQ